MEYQAILCRVIDILNEKLNVNKSLLYEKNFNAPLTGSIFRLEPNEMVHLFFAIEEYFNIKINCMTMLNYKFNTVNGIVELISQSLDCMQSIT